MWQNKQINTRGNKCLGTNVGLTVKYVPDALGVRIQNEDRITPIEMKLLVPRSRWNKCSPLKPFAFLFIVQSTVFLNAYYVRVRGQPQGSINEQARGLGPSWSLRARGNSGRNSGP